MLACTRIITEVASQFSAHGQCYPRAGQCAASGGTKPAVVGGSTQSSNHSNHQSAPKKAPVSLEFRLSILRHYTTHTCCGSHHGCAHVYRILRGPLHFCHAHTTVLTPFDSKRAAYSVFTAHTLNLSAQLYLGCYGTRTGCFQI